MNNQQHDLNPKTPQQIETERLSKFPDAPYHAWPTGGVLLSDEIERYAREYNLLYPFRKENLKPAAYELRVGNQYSSGGKTYKLTSGQKLQIPPFEVAIVETLETINMPKFLIGRWNIRTRWAYKGLLWVGGPQVDAGFRGYLACPLYNLSNTNFEIEHGEPIAVIDFVTTTKPSSHSLPYNWAGRSRAVFADYEPDLLQSALVTEAANKLKKLDVIVEDTQRSLKTSSDKIDSIQTRVDGYIVTTFTIIAILFAALGFLSRSPETSFLSPPAILASIAVWFALRSFYFAQIPQKSPSKLRLFEVAVGLVLAGVVFFFQYRLSSRENADWLNVRDSALRTGSEVEQLKRDSATQHQNEKRLDSLQQQLDDLRTKKH